VAEHRVIRPAEGAVVAEPANDVHLQALVTAAAYGPDVSVTWVQIAGRHRRLRTDRSTRVYAVLTGALRFQLGTDPELAATAGDVIVVPQAVPYELAGTGSYLVINAPAFVDGDDVYLEGDPPGTEGTT
jgi:mannose-6-phosphate isomerase-like protein (cupin superfamily)